jgi:hypothetical protein
MADAAGMVVKQIKQMSRLAISIDVDHRFLEPLPLASISMIEDPIANADACRSRMFRREGRKVVEAHPRFERSRWPSKAHESECADALPSDD